MNHVGAKRGWRSEVTPVIVPRKEIPVRKLAVNTFVSLDGVMQALGSSEEDPTGGFTHGGWSVNYWDDEMMSPRRRSSRWIGATPR
jgi:hypothetical protein